MVVTVVSNLTLLDEADVTDDWSTTQGGSGLEANDEFQRTGVACIGAKISNEEAGVELAISGGRNMAGEHLYAWVQATLGLDPVGTGIRVILGDGTNENEYEVFNSLTYLGGWQVIVLDCDAVPTVDGGTNIGAVTTIAFEMDTAQSVTGNISSFFVDKVTVQPSSETYAIEVSGGLTGDRGTWQEIVAHSVNDEIGVVERRSGIIVLNGPIEFGITTAADTFFEDTDEVCVFQNQFVEDAFYALNFVGNSGQTNHFRLGVEVGSGDDSRGTGGGLIKSAGATFKIVATDANMNPLDFFGVVVDGADTTQWEQTNAQAVSCTWTNSGQITHDNGAEMREGTISASTTILASHTGASDLDFNDNGGSPDTIVRPSGDWISDGFEVGDEVVITATSSNNISMIITVLTATVLSVATGTIVDEQNTSGLVEAKGSGAIQFLQNPTTPEFRDMSIINCVHGIEWDLDGTNDLDLRNVKYAGNTADVRFNHESGLLTVNVLELGGTPSTSDGGAGGTITVVSAVSILVTIKSAGTGGTIEGVSVFIDEDPVSIPPTLFSGTTNSSGVFSASYGGTTPLDVTVRARLRGLIPVSVLSTILEGTGLIVPITMTRDSVVDRV